MNLESKFGLSHAWSPPSSCAFWIPQDPHKDLRWVLMALGAPESHQPSMKVLHSPLQASSSW